MKMTKPTFKENKLAGKPCGLGGGGELGTQCFQECHTHLDNRAETGQCKDLVEQNGSSVFIRGQLAWITGSIMTSSCKSSQNQKEKY